MAGNEKKYHRDDLRGDLLRAGRAYIEQHGHSSLSVRTLAQTVGVSAGAPYHHFRDRRSLLLALALDGYAELTAKAVEAVSASNSPEDGLTALAMNFVDFADASPHLLELMYESELTSPMIDPSMVQFQKAGQLALLETLRNALPDCHEDELSLRILALWSTIYGYASLRRKQMIQAYEPTHLGQRELSRRTMMLAVDAAMRSGLN